MLEKNFDVPFIADLALREKQIQQNYRPIIAVHKWFARRPGTLFRGLLLSEFSDDPLREAFFRVNQFSDKEIADPFRCTAILEYPTRDREIPNTEASKFGRKFLVL